MPTIFFTVLFWVYWLIAAFLGLALLKVFLREGDRGIKATAAMLLVPVVLRLFLVK